MKIIKKAIVFGVLVFIFFLENHTLYHIVENKLYELLESYMKTMIP